MKALARLHVVGALAWRQLVGHRRRNAFTAALLTVNACFVVVGFSIVTSVQGRVFSLMSRTMMGSFQVYAAEAPQELYVAQSALGMGSADIGIIDLPKVRAYLQRRPEVKQVLPMGTVLAECILPNQLEAGVEALRQALRSNDDARIERAAARMRYRIAQVAGELQRLNGVARGDPPSAGVLAALERAQSAALWQSLRADAASTLAWLEDSIVPIAGDTDRVAMPLMGVDQELARQGFKSWEVIKGSWVPPGQRGLLVNSFLWDLYYELSVSRELKRLYKDVVVDHKVIAAAPFKARVATLTDNVEDILQYLDATQSEWVAQQVREHLHVEGGDAESLLKSLLAVDEQTLPARFKFFYGTLAPKLRLHRIEPGDDVLLRAWGKFPTSVSVKLYGVIQIPEFKDVISANFFNRVDMVSFRALDGELTDDVIADFDALKKEVATQDVDIDDIEAMFKSGNSMFVDESTLAKPGADDLPLKARDALADTFAQTDVDMGRVEHAAVFLEDDAAVPAVTSWVKASSSAAGVPLKIGGPHHIQPFVTYNVEFFAGMMSVGAAIVFAVIVLVSLLAISILVIGRMREIGVLRAIGAAPGVAAQALLLEMGLLGAGAGFIGTGLGALIIHLLAIHGVPAVNPALALLFAGPKLLPVLSAFAVSLGLCGSMVVAFVATLYPAYLATKAQPVFALR